MMFLFSFSSFFPDSHVSGTTSGTLASGITLTRSFRFLRPSTHGALPYSNRGTDPQPASCPGPRHSSVFCGALLHLPTS